VILQQNITWKVWPRSCTSHEFSACTLYSAILWIQ